MPVGDAADRRNALVWATLDRPMPPLVWGKASVSDSGWVATGLSPAGHVLVLTPAPVRASLLVLAATITEHRLVDVRTGQRPKLGSLASAMEKLEVVVLADGRFPVRSPVAWEDWTPPPLQPGDWIPGPMDLFTVQMHMPGRKGMWIAARSGGGFSVSLDRWRNFKVVGADRQPLDLGNWANAMNRCKEKDAR